ncbi:uncharacterized protein [Spinacia oleracea]|uniref:Uncharacterized protein isoform X2 n=1 Tax=Spinacia oleracea TaxID=3562 RepID=A0ABM3R4Q5_SPIOL|nr:uncharacterized protein LOC110780310 isoform X2 [Spinacia oleracea]
MQGNFPPSKWNKPIFDDVNVVRLVREESPEHCILKIDSFSKAQDALFESGNNHFKSTEFKAGSYTWVFSVYPKGNKEAGGADHLSLYVTLVDKLDFGSFVNAALRFFIYDKNRDNYLTILDIRDKRFHTLKSTFGIPKFLPLSSFTDASNGFLVDDCCAFGVEVLVRSGQQVKGSVVSGLEAKQVKGSIVSSLEDKCDRTYTWRIEHFSNLKNPSYSPEFCLGEWSWRLSLYPRGNPKQERKELSLYLSLYLELVNAKNLTQGSKLLTEFQLCLKNQGKGEDLLKDTSCGFCSEKKDWGYDCFLPISDLHSVSKSFLVGDTLIMEVLVKDMKKSYW